MPEPPIKAPSVPGLSVIEASAGTGKTWTIAHLVPLWLARGTVERLDQMVLVTFTEAAAGELGERVRRTLETLVGLAAGGASAPEREPGLGQILEELAALSDKPVGRDKKSPRQAALDRLRNALDEADRLLVCTIHSFCRRVLSDEAFLCALPAGFGVERNPLPLLERGSRDAWRARVENDPLVAAVAAREGWKSGEDLKLIRAASGKPGLRVEPDLDFSAVRARLAADLDALRRCRGECSRALERVRTLLDKGASLNKAGTEKIKGADAWPKLLESLDPRRPGPGLFDLLEGLLSLPDWLSKTKGQAALKAEVKQASLDFESLDLLARARAALAGAGQLRWAWLNTARKTSEGALEQELRRAKALSYDGLTLKLRDALLAGDPGLRADLLKRLRKRWKLALVDESQDTDPAQLEIFKAVFAPKDNPSEQRLVLVGDPKQAIYGFRGADLRAYLKARNEAAETLTLVDTYRSAPGLVQVQNALWKLAAPALGHPDLDVPPARPALTDAALPLPGGTETGPRLVAALVPESGQGAWGKAERRRFLAAEATASAIVDVLGQALGGGVVEAGHCAVLTAGHRDARSTQEALARRGVAAVLVKAGNVFLCDEAGDLSILWRALLDPRDARLRRAALATRLLGLDSPALARLDEARDEAWRLRFLDWRGIWRAKGLAALFQAMDQEPEARCFLNLARLPSGERRVTDLKHLLDLAGTEEAQKSAGPEALLQWLESCRAEADEKNAPEEHLRRLEHDGAAVQILTMHGAKGLEFDLVFCPNLGESAWEGQARRSPYALVRDDRDGWVLYDRKRVDLGAGAALAGAEALEELQEDLRRAYVALTRAKRRVWLLAGWVGYQGGKAATLPSALDWLLRDTRKPDAQDPSAWLARMLEQKKNAGTAANGNAPASGPACEHEAALQRLAEEAPGLVEITAPRIHEQGAVMAGAESALPEAAQRHKSGFGDWRRLSYSSLLRGRGDDEDAWRNEDEPGLPRPKALQDAETPLLLESLPGGKNTGNCLHWLLERWNFRDDPKDLIHGALDRFGLDLAPREDRQGAAVPATADLLARALPRWARARLPVLDAALGEAAHGRLSELRFLLPLGPRGLGGEDLAALFQTHGDGPLQAYGESLKSLPTEALNGMLEGSLDRLAQVGRRWAVLDWKSNRPGDSPADYRPETLWSLAAEEHYILQVLLYMVAARRYLARRGQGDGLVCGGLVFLRGLDGGLERGVLMFSPPTGLLDALDRLFLPGRAT